ncbi:PTS sugar transporter subunit IIA [Falsiroseomonas sp. E2-1-a4]|uniref:PTS sugar transporter subunit IIA n=1 Tax=Falsiroseomonas sp. E2-1-a4 TaxID=3239299 RepID=UPI003F400DDF
MVTTQQISAADVLLDLDGGSKRRVLEALSAEAARRSGRAREDILAALQAREALGSTALGRGVALPHARMAGDYPPLMLFARLAKPIDYEARDEEPVDLVILVLWPEAAPEGFLPTLAATCRPLRAPAALRRLRAATSAEEVVAVLARYGSAENDPEDDR